MACLTFICALRDLRALLPLHPHVLPALFVMYSTCLTCPRTLGALAPCVPFCSTCPTFALIAQGT